MSCTSSDETCVGAKGSVTVVVRVRGQNAKEAGMPVVTKVMDENVIVFDPKLVTSPDFHSRKRKFRDLNKRENKNAMFQFDRVFDNTCTSSDVFEYSVKNVISDVLNGFNACGKIFF
jgi:kinesin family protein 18/19